MAEESIGVGMIGCGTVGLGVARLLHEQAERYQRRLGRRLELRRVLVRRPEKLGGESCLKAEQVTRDPDAFFATADMPIVVEVAGGTGVVGDYVRRALRAGKHVVTANKSLLAAQGPDLFALARRHDAAIAFEASCAGGIPIITALTFGLMANEITALYGILNGTCNYILTRMTRHGKSYEEALAEAQEKGYAEADPALDVSGQDAGQKLAILASIAFGVRITGGQVACTGIEGLALEDIRYGGELGYDIKLIAMAERNGAGVTLAVRPCFIQQAQPLAQVEGSFNAVSVYGDAVGHTMYLGRGAGRMPTASAIVSDLLNVASGWYPQAMRNLHLLADIHKPAPSADPAERLSRFYLRADALDVPGVMARITSALGAAGISIAAVLQHESEPGRFVPVVILTHHARQGALAEAVRAIEALESVRSRPVVIPILDLPEG